MAYEREKRYIEDKLAQGEKQFSRSNPYVQSLLRAAGNIKEIESFLQTTDLRSKLY